VRRLMELAPRAAFMPDLGMPPEPDHFSELPVITRRPSWHWHGLWH